MAERSFPLENTLYTAEEASLWFAPRTSGVHASDVLGVTASDGLSVTVAPGIAWLKYAEFAGVAYGNTEAKRLQLDAASTNYPRIDRIVIRYSKSENKVYLAVRKGTAAKSPSAPAIVRDANTYEISLAQVRVNAGATSVSSITDERLNNDVCGLMTDGVTPYQPEEEEPAGGGDADSLGGVAASVYQDFMARKTLTVSANSSFVKSGSITAERKGGVLKVGGYLQTKVAQAGDGYETHIICTINGVKVNGNQYSAIVDHATGKSYNILLMASGNNSVVQLESAAYQLPASTWLNFGIVGIIA